MKKRRKRLLSNGMYRDELGNDDGETYRRCFRCGEMVVIKGESAGLCCACKEALKALHVEASEWAKPTKERWHLKKEFRDRLDYPPLVAFINECERLEAWKLEA